MGVEKWEQYYQKNSIIVNLIEKINKLYFTKIFEKGLCPSDSSLILEPGCGSGLTSARLAKKGHKVVVLDISENALKTARQNFVNLKLPFLGVKADICHMPFKNNIFDMVWNQGVIEHFNNPEVVVREMFRLIKQDGKLILYVPAFLSFLHITYFCLNALKLDKLWPFDRQIFFKNSYLKKVMDLAGCSNINIKRMFFSSFNLSLKGVCRK